MIKNLSLAAALLFLFVACSSGGGGGEAGPGRTRDTALRLIHGAVDVAPLELSIPNHLVQAAYFNQVTAYQKVEQGATTVSVHRQNSPGVLVGSFSSELLAETEYTLFVSGRASYGEMNLELLEDVVERPESGFAHFQVLNSYTENPSISISIDGVDFASVLEGASSGYSLVASGPRTISVYNSSGGIVTSESITLEDRCELTLLVSGSRELGAAFTQKYTDCD